MEESQIFNEARKLPDRQRGDYLDRACGGDSELRASVEALLRADMTIDPPIDDMEATGAGDSARADPDATGLHDSNDRNSSSQSDDHLSFDVDPPETSDSASPGNRRVPGGRLGTGDWVGPYKLLQQIGEGGMGTVWMAEQRKPIRRRVALKIIKAGMDSSQVVARFEAERQALSMMEHPNIARVLDAGTTELGRPYFVMELVNGTPITDFCDNQKLSIDGRLELFAQACMAVQHAHQKGIIHRDLKPSNILVTMHDDKAVPKVIDFGIAKAMHQQLTDKTMFTAFGQAIGTYEYMSPEQAQRSDLDIDTRSDVYSLGVLLYEMLTGSTPLRRESLREAMIDEIVVRIKEEDPQRPSTRVSESADALESISSIRQVDPKRFSALMKGELDWIVLKSLEKDRTRRYESASAFAADVNNYLNSEPVLARPQSAAYRLKKLARKHRQIVTFAAVIATLLVASTIVASYLAIWASSESATAKANAVKADASAQKAEAETVKAKKALLQVEKSRDTAERSAYYGAIQTITSDIRADDYTRLSSTLLEQPPEYRGWEWGYLMTAARLPEEFLPKEIPMTSHVALSPDQDSLLTVYWEKVTLSSLSNRKVIWTSDAAQVGAGDSGPVFLNAGRYIALVSRTEMGQQVVILDARNGKVVKRIDPVNASSICAHPVKPLLYIGSGTGELLVVETETWKVERRKKIGVGQILEMAISSDGRYLATAHKEIDEVYIGAGNVYLRSADSFEIIHHIRRGYARDLTFSNKLDALILISGWGGGVISVGTGEEMRYLEGSNRDPFAVSISADEGYIAIGDHGGVVRIFDTGDIKSSKTQRCKTKLNFFANAEVTDIASLPNQGIAVSSLNQSLNVWNNISAHALRKPIDLEVEYQGAGSGGYHVEYQDSGRLVIATGYWTNDKILVYDPDENMQELVRLAGLEKVPLEKKWVHFRPGTNEIAAFMVDNISVFDCSDLTNSTEYPLLREIPLSDSLASFAFSPCGNLLALGYETGGVAILDATTGDLVTKVELEGFGIPTSLAFDPDETVLAIHESGKGSSSVLLCDVRNGEFGASFPVKGGYVEDNAFVNLAFHPGKRLLAISDQGGSITICDWNSGEIIKTLQAPIRSDLRSLQFSPDGQRLIASSDQFLFQIWDWQLGKPLYSLPSRWNARDAVFSPDGRSIAGSAGMGMQIWNAEPFNASQMTPGRKAKRLEIVKTGQANSAAPKPPRPNGDQASTSSKKASPDPDQLKKLARREGDLKNASFAIVNLRHEHAIAMRDSEFSAAMLIAENKETKFAAVDSPHAPIMAILAAKLQLDTAKAIGQKDVSKIRGRLKGHLEKLEVQPEYTRSEAEAASELDLLLRAFQSLRGHVDASEFDGLIARFRKTLPSALSRVQRYYAASLNNIAWDCSTSGNPSKRNGKLAVALAKLATEFCNETERGGRLDTLATSYAEVGDFDAAIKAIKEAIACAKSGSSRADFESRLKLFEQKKPYRTAPPQVASESEEADSAEDADEDNLSPSSVADVQFIAHRGASYAAPENTMAAVRLAWEMDVDAEIDVHLSKDNRIVVVHDATFERTAGIDRAVAEMESQDIRKLDVGSYVDEKFKGEPVPFLSDVLPTIPPDRRLFVEIKSGPAIVPYLEKVLKQSGKLAQIVIISFDFETVLRSKEGLPDVPAFWLRGTARDKETKRPIPHDPKLVRWVADQGIDGLNVDSAGVDKKFMDAVRAAKQKLFVWTVDDPAEAKRMVNFGVSGITTNRPKWLKEQLSEKQKP